MKKNLLFAGLLLLSYSASIGQSSTYKGNGKSDFGGAVGQGSININSTQDSIFFTFTKGPGIFDSVLVIYLDGQPGGISTTAGSGGNNDVYYRATTGYKSSTQQSPVNFPANFQPDAAIAFDKNGGEVLYWAYGFLLQGSTFSITPTGVNNARSYSTGVAKTDLGLSAGSTVNFNFIGTYIGSNCYRSTEGIGDTSATLLRVDVGAGGSRTAGYNAYSPKTFFSYSSLTLPLKLTDFRAAKVGSEVAINWLVAEESNIDRYDLQRSSDGIHFTTISTVKATNAAIPTQYNTKDASAGAGANYYRLLIVERDKSEYSSVLMINNSSLKNSFVATYAGHNNLNVSLSGINAGNYKLSVFNTTGQLIQAINFVHDGATINKNVALQSNMSTGIYRIALQTKGATYTTNIMVQ
jgi:hypothetical protein